MGRNLCVMALVGLLLTLTLVAWGALGGSRADAQGGLEVGVDANPSGNSATSLGSIESCISVRNGETFSVDIFVANVKDLLGWEAYFVYDPSILQVVGRNVRMFQASSPGSNLFDASEGLPDDDGRYRLGAADIAEPPSPDSGSGVLARLTLKALSAGVSSASLPLLDLTGDGRPDLGPIMTDVAGKAIADQDGDGFFDGASSQAWIAVDAPCPDKPPPGLPTPPPAGLSPSPTGIPTMVHTVTPSPAATPPPAANGDSDSPRWAIIGGAASAAVLLTASLVLWRGLRRGPR
ncbi:MAG: cohesin domain-containing protein [Chloroflexota bacterium]|nr:cohesin domain-containing protein [Chloroflexota bacterium]